jgi:hypothetical protein
MSADTFTHLMTSPYLVDCVRESMVLHASLVDCIVHMMTRDQGSMREIISTVTPVVHVDTSATEHELVSCYLDAIQSPRIWDMYTMSALTSIHVGMFPCLSSEYVGKECLVLYNHFIDCCTDIPRLEMGSTIHDAHRTYKQLLSSRCLDTFDAATRISILGHLSSFVEVRSPTQQIVENCVGICRLYMQCLDVTPSKQASIEKKIRSRVHYAMVPLVESVITTIPEIVKKLLVEEGLAP